MFYICESVLGIGRVHVRMERVKHFESPVYELRAGEELVELCRQKLRHHVGVESLAIDLLTRKCNSPICDLREEWVRFIGLYSGEE